MGSTSVLLSASSKPNFYDLHPEAKKKRLEMAESISAATRYLVDLVGDGAPRPKAGVGSVDELIRRLARRKPREMEATGDHGYRGQDDGRTAYAWLVAMLLNNDFQSTGKCVEYIRGLALEADTYYVHRGFSFPKRPDLLSADLSILGPEEDTSVYYGRLRPLTLGLASDSSAVAGPRSLPRLTPPPGVDAGAFFDLVESSRRGIGENLLSIDQAANNTSVVFLLEWKGWRLLFPW